MGRRRLLPTKKILKTKSKNVSRSKEKEYDTKEENSNDRH